MIFQVDGVVRTTQDLVTMGSSTFVRIFLVMISVSQLGIFAEPCKRFVMYGSPGADILSLI